MIEEFRLIQDYPAYRVSNLGRVQSRWARRSDGRGKRELSNNWHDLKPGVDKKGYLTLGLCNGKDKPKSFRIHRLVALAFLPSSPDAQCVRHLDGVCTNNCADNLAWGTYKENENDKRNHGTYNTRYAGAKLNAIAITEIRKLYTQGISQNTLASQYGVSRPTITRIINKSIWRYV